MDLSTFRLGIVAFSLSYISGLDAADHQGQLPPAHMITWAGGPGRWQEGALLQALVVEHEAACFPVQEFDLVPALVDEDKHFTILRAAP